MRTRVSARRAVYGHGSVLPPILRWADIGSALRNLKCQEYGEVEPRQCLNERAIRWRSRSFRSLRRGGCLA